MAQLFGASSHKWKVVGSIPSQGMYLGCGFDLWLGGNESLSLSVSLSLSLCLSVSLSSSISKINTYILGEY